MASRQSAKCTAWLLILAVRALSSQQAPVCNASRRHEACSAETPRNRSDGVYLAESLLQHHRITVSASLLGDGQASEENEKMRGDTNPRILWLVFSEMPSLEGEFDKMDDTLLNGEPVWRRASSGQGWIYSDIAGHWVVARTQESFKAGTGVLISRDPHRGDSPDAAQQWLSRAGEDSGDGWKLSPSTLIVRTPQGKERCWMPAALQEDGQMSKAAGPYISTNKTCPDECPFSQGLAEDHCLKACTRGDQCAMVHPFRIYPDNESMECAPTCGSYPDQRISGCLECASAGVCKRCSLWAYLSNEGTKCNDVFMPIWKLIYFAAGVCGVIFVLYLVHLQFRPNINPVLVKRAELHRDLCRPWMLDTSGQEAYWRQYPLLTPLHLRDTSGLGTMLYFRWTRCLLVMAILLLGIFFLTFNIALEDVAAGDISSSFAAERKIVSVTLGPEACPEIVVALQLSNVLSSANLEQRRKPNLFKKIKLKVRPKSMGRGEEEDEEYWETPAGNPTFFASRMACMVMFAYCLLSGVSLAFSRQQRQFTVQWQAAHPSHDVYTLKASGVAARRNDPAELREFFQQTLDSIPGITEKRQLQDRSKVIGVSIAYDYGKEQETIDRGLNALTQTLADAFDARRGSARSVVEKDALDPSSSHFLKASSASLLRKIDRSFLDNEQPLEADWEQDLRNKLGEFQCSGDAFVVLSSLEAKDQLLQSSGQLVLDESVITLVDATGPPAMVQWQNFGFNHSLRRMAKNLSFIFLMMILWAAFYVPQAVYGLSAVATAGEMSSIQETALGMLIAVGNTLVTMGIQVTVDHCGFHSKDRRDATTMVLVFLTTVINTAADICIVFFVVRGIALDLALHATLDHSHYDRIIARELYALIVPGFLITPYFTAPIFEDWLPQFMNRRLVRSTRGVSVSQAEKKFMLPEFDIAWRYSDTLTNFMVCLSLLMFGSHYMYLIFFWLIGAIVSVYTIDQYWVLRMTSRSCVTEYLSTAFSYWWSLPTGFLGSIGMHWAVEAQWLNVPRSAEYFLMVLFLAVHCVIYCFLLSWLRSSVQIPEQQVRGYNEMSKMKHEDFDFQTYFNTNPVHVLRSWFMPSSEAEGDRGMCVPFVQGKEHLQLAWGDGGAGASVGATLEYDRLNLNAAPIPVNAGAAGLAWLELERQRGSSIRQ